MVGMSDYVERINEQQRLNDEIRARLDEIERSAESLEDSETTRAFRAQLAKWRELNRSHAAQIATLMVRAIGLLHGKTRAPTLAEAAAHNGRWLVHCADLYSVDVVEITDGRVWCDGFSWPLAEFVAANPGALWRPINADRAIVAWPEVAP